ncbi:MAG: hypothetical protein ACREV1_11010 [Gammaproteobacteria bacterium]
MENINHPGSIKSVDTLAFSPGARLRNEEGDGETIQGYRIAISEQAATKRLAGQCERLGARVRLRLNQLLRRFKSTMTA